MKKVLSQGLGLVLLAVQFCFGIQTETMQVRRFINPESTAAKLEYRVTLLQDSFLLYDPVGIELWVKNFGPDTAEVWLDPMQGWILWDQDGKVYPSSDHVHYTGPEVISPGDSLGGLTGLSDHGVVLPGPYRHRVLPRGEYKIYYKIDSDSTLPFNFKVVEPQGEEAKALKQYLDAFSPTSEEKFFKTSRPEKRKFFAENVKRLLQFADRYPASTYAVTALSYASTTAWVNLRDRQLVHKIQMKLIRDYPDSRIDHIGYLKFHYINNPTAFRAILDSVVKANFHPKLTAKAKEALKKLDNKTE